MQVLISLQCIITGHYYTNILLALDQVIVATNINYHTHNNKLLVRFNFKSYFYSHVH